jgi:expansin (peptidoglycan-binding protein)
VSLAEVIHVIPLVVIEKEFTTIRSLGTGAGYKGGALKWDTIIEEKAMEVGRYLVGRSHKIDFSEP